MAPLDLISWSSVVSHDCLSFPITQPENPAQNHTHNHNLSQHHIAQRIITNKKVTMWLFVRSTNKTSTIAHGWVEQAKTFPFNIYNWTREDEHCKEGSNGMFYWKMILMTRLVKSHPQSGTIGLVLHLC